MFLLASSLGAQLELRGDGSSINFAPSGAKLSATCPNGDAKLVFLEPGASAVRAHLLGVPPTCIDSSVNQPCASVNPSYPRLFYCKWTPPTGDPMTVGPLRAVSSKEENADGQLLGFATFVSCPLPSASEYGSKELKLNLTVAHGPIGSVKDLPWAGEKDASVVSTELDDATGKVVVKGAMGSEPTWLSVKMRRDEGGEIEDQLYYHSMLQVGSLNSSGSVTAYGGIFGPSLSLSGDATVGGKVKAKSIESEGAVSGASLSVSGDATIKGDATVSGKVSGASIKVTGKAEAASVSASGAVSGASLSASGDATIKGDATVSGKVSGASIKVTGKAEAASVTASGAISGASLSASGDATVGGKVAVTGEVTAKTVKASGVIQTGSAGGAASSYFKGDVSPHLSSFKVEGDADTFYPIVFNDHEWGAGPWEFEITRSSVHSDKSWHGALQARVATHTAP